MAPYFQAAGQVRCAATAGEEASRLAVWGAYRELHQGELVGRLVDGCFRFPMSSCLEGSDPDSERGVSEDLPIKRGSLSFRDRSECCTHMMEVSCLAFGKVPSF